MYRAVFQQSHEQSRQLFTTFYEVNCATIVFLSLWLLADLGVRYGILHRHSTTIRQVIKCNSWLYSVASLTLSIALLSTPDDGQTTLRQIYHLSKFYEYIDILLVRASGAPIGLHFGFHHLTTPYLTLIRVVRHSVGWQTGAILNAIHHTLMYAFFGGAQVLRRALPVTGTLQLIVGLIMEFRFIWAHDGTDTENPVWPNITTAGFLLLYLILFVRELPGTAGQRLTRASRQYIQTTSWKKQAYNPRPGASISNPWSGRDNPGSTLASKQRSP